MNPIIPVNVKNAIKVIKFHIKIYAKNKITNIVKYVAVQTAFYAKNMNLLLKNK
jgi:hypothetical protein